MAALNVVLLGGESGGGSYTGVPCCLPMRSFSKSGVAPLPALTVIFGVDLKK